VNIKYTDKDGTDKTIADKLSLPPDLANGILALLLTDADPKVETTLSMVVSTPKPRVVKLKISASDQDSFSVGGSVAKATHYIVKIDIGGVTGVAAKVLGKQPPPVHIWVAAGHAPVFLKSEGPSLPRRAHMANRTGESGLAQAVAEAVGSRTSDGRCARELPSPPIALRLPSIASPSR
jgi:hypothetical protein